MGIYKWGKGLNKNHNKEENCGDKRKTKSKGVLIISIAVVSLFFMFSLKYFLSSTNKLNADMDDTSLKCEPQFEENQNENLFKESLTYYYSSKEKEDEVAVKDYSSLQENIKLQAENSLGKISGKYSLTFIDLTNLETLSINNNKFIAASTIKIFIMIEAYTRINEGTLREDDIIVLEDSMKVGGAGILSGRASGSKLSIKELIFLMMTKSDNTATNMLIDKLAMENINTRIKALGCNNSELNRKMMDQGAINRGIQNYTSSYDLALALSKLYNGECVSKEYDLKMIEIMMKNENKRKISSKLPKDVQVASKTGELGGVENDAAIIYTSKGAYILSITTSNGNSSEQINAISSLSKFIYDKYMAKS